MESQKRILLINEVATLLRVSHITIYRWHAESKRGNGRFPLSISSGCGNSRGTGKLRWLASDIENFLASQATRPPPVHVASASERRKEAKDHQEHRQRTEAILEKHRLNRRKKNGRQES